MTSPRFHGALAAAAALAASQVAAALLGLRESFGLAIAQAAIRLTPGGVAEPIISVVGTADKPLAVVVVVAVMLLLGGVIGSWWRAHRVRAVAGVAVLVAVATAAVLARPYGSIGGIAACLVGGLALAGVLALLHREPSHSDDSGNGQALSRRRMIKLVGAVAVATAVAGTAGELLASRRRRRRELDRLRASLQLPTRLLPTPSGVDLNVAGIAWAQHTGITKVEVRVDDGRWKEAGLASVPSEDTWVQWRWEWDAKPGEQHLQVRATDKTGYTQTSERADVVPDGATGYHGVDISVA